MELKKTCKLRVNCVYNH